MNKKTSLLLAGAVQFVFSTAVAQEPVDLEMVNRIIDQSTNQSAVMDHLAHLSDVIGPRLTGSPAMLEANEWTRARFEEWGLNDAHLEGFEFGHGWSYDYVLARMTAPRSVQMHAMPYAWSPSTNGLVKAPVMVAEIGEVEDFEKYRSKLDGKILLLSRAREIGREPRDNPFRRLDDAGLKSLGEFDLRPANMSWMTREIETYAFSRALGEFLAEEGVVATLRRADRDAGLISAESYLHMQGLTTGVPSLNVTSEDYGRMVRLIEMGHEVEVELQINARFYADDSQAYSTIAEIPGQGRNPEIVMAGAHMDSWFMGDGAVDNGAGTAVVMEAARILAALGVQPKRTIRFGLWGGEEQAYFGSLTYVARHFADRPDGDDVEDDWIPGFTRFAANWPIEVKPDHARFSAYFNMDNGSGKVRGIYAEHNIAVAPIFAAWLEPFELMGASTVVLNRTSGTDHQPFQWVGLPGFQFIQDPLDYGSRLHHTQIDTLDHAQPDDLRQAAAIMASFLYHAAMRDERMPRKPMPSVPQSDDKSAKNDEG